jgi:hypothetical protein
VEDVRAALVGATVLRLGRRGPVGVLTLVAATELEIEVRCAFRVQRGNTVIVGSRDIELSVFDDRAARLTVILDGARPAVSDVTVSVSGDLTVSWLPDWSLTAFVDTSGSAESWRVLARDP